MLAEKVILAVALPLVAGGVNASGFLAVGTYTSHMTGHVAAIGDSLAQDRLPAMWANALLVLTFFAGAVTATLLVDGAERRARAKYVAPLLLEMAVLIAFAVSAHVRRGQGDSFALTELLCFAMGLQNALVTRISGAVIRTTHVTGLLTDLGIEAARLARWLLRQGERREGARLRLHAVVFGSFLVGAIVGPQLFLRFGQAAMIAPCLLLALLAAFDLLFGIRGGDAPGTSVPDASA